MEHREEKSINDKAIVVRTTRATVVKPKRKAPSKKGPDQVELAIRAVKDASIAIVTAYKAVKPLIEKSKKRRK